MHTLFLGLVSFCIGSLSFIGTDEFANFLLGSVSFCIGLSLYIGTCCFIIESSLLIGTVQPPG